VGLIELWNACSCRQARCGIEMLNSFEQRILDVIYADGGIGVTILDVSRMTTINRITAAKYLAVMEARGIIKCRNVGRAKLYLPAKARDDKLNAELKELA